MEKRQTFTAEASKDAVSRRRTASFAWDRGADRIVRSRLMRFALLTTSYETDPFAGRRYPCMTVHRSSMRRNGSRMTIQRVIDEVEKVTHDLPVVIDEVRKVLHDRPAVIDQAKKIMHDLPAAIDEVKKVAHDHPAVIGQVKKVTTTLRPRGTANCNHGVRSLFSGVTAVD